MQTLADMMTSTNIDALNEFIDAHYPYDLDKFVFPNIDTEFKEFFMKNIPEALSNLIHDDSYIVLRMVKPGSTARNYEFHFDAYKETILVPLMGSEATLNGDLLIYKNARKTPQNIFVQVTQKFLYQNRLALSFFKKPRNVKRFFNRISVKKGSIFIFDGVRCLHGNLPITEGERRTVLIHNKKIFSRSFVTRCIEQYSQYKVSKK